MMEARIHARTHARTAETSDSSFICRGEGLETTHLISIGGWNEVHPFTGLFHFPVQFSSPLCPVTLPSMPSMPWMPWTPVCLYAGPYIAIDEHALHWGQEQEQQRYTMPSRLGMSTKWPALI
jgi:hypothetical protein